MFKLKRRQEEEMYVYLEPQGDDGACTYQILSHEALWEKYENGSLKDGCRLFKVDREIKVSFERVIHFD